MADILVLDADGVTNPLRFSDFSRYGLSGADAAAFFNGPFKECCLIGADTRQELLRFAAERGLQLDLDGLFAHWHRDQRDTYAKVITAVTLLRQAGVHAVLATNQDPYRLEYMRTDMQYGDFFDQIFCSSEMGVIKPDPLFFLQIQSVLPAGTIRYIDDHQENVETARAACAWESHCLQGEQAVTEQLRAWWPEVFR